MKGISTILATILIVIIVVALVSLTYTFAVGLFGTASSGASSGTTALTERLQKTVEFVGAACNSTHTKFTFRHSGTVAMIGGDLALLINGVKYTALDSVALGPGDVDEAIEVHGLSSPTSLILTISAPAGSIDRTVTCISGAI